MGGFQWVGWQGRLSNGSVGPLASRAGVPHGASTVLPCMTHFPCFPHEEEEEAVHTCRYRCRTSEQRKSLIKKSQKIQPAERHGQIPLGLVCGNANDRRRDASDLMGYKYEGSYHVWIPQIGVRDNTYSL